MNARRDDFAGHVDEPGPGREPDPLVAFCRAFGSWSPNPFEGTGVRSDAIRGLRWNLEHWLAQCLGGRFGDLFAAWLLVVLAKRLNGRTMASLENGARTVVKRSEADKRAIGEALDANGYWG